MTTIYTPFVGFSDLDTGDAALMADAHATAAEHADRLYRRFQTHALCEWQRAIPDEDYDDLPDDAPGSSDPETGESERYPRRILAVSPSCPPSVLPADATAANGIGCPKCQRAYEDDARWPVEVNGAIVDGGCQTCWEDECAASWWEALPTLTALVPPPFDGSRASWHARQSYALRRVASWPSEQEARRVG